MKKNKVRFCLILILSFSYQFFMAQTPLIFDKSIALPEETGGFAFDIMESNGYLFLHAQHKIFVYDANDQHLVTTINLFENSNTSKIFGKYSPPYFNYNFYSPSRQTFAINQEMDLIYTITPDLNLISIKTAGTNLFQTTTLAARPATIDHFKISSGRVILKYDPVHNRLYTLFSGRDVINTTGSFHMSDSYFAIYQVNILSGALSLIHDEFKRAISTGQGGDGYNSQAIEIEFNHNLSNQTNNNKFYIARMHRIEEWEITGNPVNPVDSITSIAVSAAKIGKLLTVKKSGVHKILAFPYRLPGSGVEPDGYPIKFYVIDGDNLSFTCDSVIAPSKRVIDAAFINSSNNLVLTYANDIVNSNDTNVANADVAFYSFNQGVFVPQYGWNLQTNAYPQYDEQYNYNYPLKIIPGQNGDFYIGKKNEIIHVTETGIDPPYAFTQVIDKSGGFFMNGIQSSDHTFFISLTLNGFYHVETTPATKQQCGMPVYQSVYNPSNNKLYFFNTLNTNNSGFFIYDLNADNGNGQVETFIELDFPIGDMVYNPFRGQVLISGNKENGGNIKVLNPDNTFDQDIVVNFSNYLTEMFVSPTNQLYVLANSRNTHPSIMVFDATTYSLIKGSSINQLSQEWYKNFNADFCYNPYNKLVYATITNTPILLEPYLSMKNTCENGLNEGILLSVSETGDVSLLKTGLDYPRTIICPEIINPPEGYQGYLYINSHNLSGYDCTDNIWVEINDTIYFNEIVYNQHANSLFGFSDQTTTIPPLGAYANDRVARFYRILKEAGSTHEITEIGHYNGQIAAFFNNPYDGNIYVQTKFDVNKFGETTAQLLQYSPLSANNTFLFVDLPVTSYYAEFDHFKDGLIGLFNYNLITPYINPYQNKIFLPNGAHSNVSVVEFEPNELLPLNNEEYDWLSFPRLNRAANNPMPVNDVLEDNIFPDDYESQSELQNVPPNGTDLVYSVFTGFEWSITSGLSEIQSTRGYKLHMNYTSPYPDQRWLEMEGTVIDPSTPMPLYMGKENWVGYFLYKQQNIMDALGSTLYSLDWVKAEDWFCWYAGPLRDPNNPVAVTEGWLCDNKAHNIGYGQMVVLKAGYFDPSPIAFTWQGVGRSIVDTPKAGAEYFTYTETADYTPVVVLLDTTETISEIGVFVNDSCMGACTVLPEDTLVGIRAYLDGQPGDSLVFETYTNTKSTAREEIRSYYVFDPEKKRYEHRSIHLGERKGLYQVSFKNQPLVEEPTFGLLSNFLIYPNPASGQLMVVYELEEEVLVSLEVYDLFGRKVATLIQGIQPSGTRTFNWNLMQAPGQRLMSGIYSIRMKAGTENMTKKVVIN